MAENTLNRERLEQDIIQKGWAVDVSLVNAKWLESESFQTFQQAWQKLVDYYTENADDSVIGVEVLKEYLDHTRILRKLICNPDLSTEDREKAEDNLISLENLLEGIITEVVSYLQSNQD